MAGVALVALPWLRPNNERARAAVVAVVVVLMWRYMVWRWFSTLPPMGLNIDWIVGVLFACIETLAMMGTTLGLVGLTRLSNRTPEVERNLGWLDGARTAAAGRRVHLHGQRGRGDPGAHHHRRGSHGLQPLPRLGARRRHGAPGSRRWRDGWASAI